MISSLSFCALHCSYVLHVLPKKPSFNRVNRKVRLLEGEKGQFRRSRPSNPSLGMKILQNKITGTQTRFSTNFGGKLSFIMSVIFPQRFHCCYIYFIAPICTTPIITLKPCPLMLSFSISYSDLIKSPYFADTTEKGHRG